MRRALTLTCVVFVSLWSTSVHAQDDVTYGLRNGRFWRDMAPDLSVKAVFLSGLIEGWKLRDQVEDVISGAVVVAMSPGGTMQYADLAVMVDATYEHAENLSLPVGWVVMASFAVQRGDTTRDMVFPALRRHLAELRNTTTSRPTSEVSPIDTILSVSRLASPR